MPTSNGYKKGYKVFMYTENPPTECRCGCGAYKHLFTQEKQEHNYNLYGGAYRVFANSGHLERYAKTAPESQD